MASKQKDDKAKKKNPYK